MTQYNQSIHTSVEKAIPKSPHIKIQLSRKTSESAFCIIVFIVSRLVALHLVTNIGIGEFFISQLLQKLVFAVVLCLS